MGQIQKTDTPPERIRQVAEQQNAARHALLAHQIPMLYMMMLIASLLILLGFWDTAPILLTGTVPSTLMIIISFRMLHWIRQRNANPTAAEVTAQLRTTTVLGPVVSFGFTVWAALLFDYADAAQQAFVVLMVLICATATAVCTAVLPLTAGLVIAAAYLPFIVKLVLTGNDVMIAMLIAFIAIAGLLQQVLRTYCRAFNEGIKSRILLSQRNQQITQTKRQITRIAYRDELTGIANKRRFDDALQKQLDRPEKPDQRLLVGIIDLDGFGTINDVFGYDVGNEVLKQAALRLSSAIKGHGMVARYDGDEFAFMLKSFRDDNEALGFANQICQSLQDHFQVGAHTAILSTSCGLAIFPDSADTAELLCSRAYHALHHAKRSAGTDIAVFHPDHEYSVQRSAQLEQALRHAVRDTELDLAYQPIVDMTTLQPVAFEALARWRDSKLGFIPPDQFIPIAETTGLISELTMQLLNKAVATARQWPQDVQLSFNMSAKEIVKTSTGLRTLSILADNQFPGQRLDIEITETAFLKNMDAAISTIGNLKSSGVSIALDDFGTGHASLGYVGKIPLDKLKIDRSFITSIESNSRNQHIVKAIIDMCSNLDIKCIAEGIETQAEFDALCNLGCRFGQGYLFARPMSNAETLEFIAEAADYSPSACHKAAH